MLLLWGHILRNLHLWSVLKTAAINLSFPWMTNWLWNHMTNAQIWGSSFLFSPLNHWQLFSEGERNITKDPDNLQQGQWHHGVKFQQKNTHVNFFHLTCFFVISIPFLFSPHIIVFLFCSSFSSLGNDTGSISYSKNFEVMGKSQMQCNKCQPLKKATLGKMKSKEIWNQI